MESSPPASGVAAPARVAPAPSRPEPAGDQPAGAEPGERRAADRWSRLLRGRLDRSAVTVGELIVFGLATAIAVVALVSLATAHLGVHGLVTVGFGSALLLAVLAVLTRLKAAMPRVVLDLPGLFPTAVTGLLGLFMFLPGFHYVAGDKDPGGYVSHAFSIARTGSYDIIDPLMTTPGLPLQFQAPGARFPAVWVHDLAAGQIVPQFYHLWPALLGTAYDVKGYGGLANTAPLLGVVAVMLAVLLTRRIAGAVAGWAVGALLTTNMMEVWQAKYPTAEILAQMLYLAALLGVVLAIQTRWRWPALVAGLLVGIGYLNRADALLLVLFAVGTLAVLWVIRRFDARAGWFAIGLGAVLPYGLWQAYGPAKTYTLGNAVPKLSVVLGLIVLSVVAALLLRPPLAPLARWVTARAENPRVQRWIGSAVLLLAIGLFILGGLRPKLGPAYMNYNGRTIRSYDEQSLHRLSWFLTWPGLAVMLVGIGWVALRRWTPSGWLVLVPTAGLLVLYCYQANNSPYLMWWGRRFISSVVPGIVVLIAFGLAWLWVLRIGSRGWRVGVPAALALTTFVLVVQLNQSLPVRSHDEWGGSRGVVAELAGLAGDKQGIYLWDRARYCCASPQQMFAPPLWLVENEQSVLLPARAQQASYVAAYLRQFPERPVFLVYDDGTAPPPMPGINVTVAKRLGAVLPHWEESSIERPDGARQIPFSFTVYRVEPATG
jgi:hypothetical protein